MELSNKPFIFAPVMKRICGVVFLLTLLPTTMLAQTEVNNGKSLGSLGSPTLSSPTNALLSDSIRLHGNPEFTTPVMTKEPSYGQHQEFMETNKSGSAGFALWKGASLGFQGTNYHLPGLLDTASGSVTLHQDLNRWHFDVSGLANKYWMPWQRRLTTQYGFGGTVGYDVSNTLSLHAFGYYYANKLQVGPAMSPYVASPTYGGYADIRISSKFGTKLGAQRYINPLTGKWTTEPIVNPYFKIGDSKIELPLGALLKTFVEGRQDNPMQFRPHPMKHPVNKR